MIGERQTGLRSSGLLVLAALLLAVGTSCGLRPVPGIIKLGLVAPLGGSDAATGLQMLFAVRLALREWNAGGGIDGYRVALVSEDDRNDATEGEQQARTTVVDPAVVGVIGHVTAESALAAGPRYDESGLALITFADVASWTNGTTPSTTFRLTPPPGEWVHALADLVVQRARASSVAIVHESGPANEAFVRFVTDALRSSGVLSVRAVVVSPTQSRYDAAVQSIVDGRPEAIVLATNFVTAGEIAVQARSLTAVPIVLASQAERPEILRIGGSALEGAYTLSPALGALQTERAQQFIASYRQLAGTAPGEYAALAYDATNLLLTAAGRQLQHEGRIDRAGVLRELSQGDFMEGLTGPIAFDQQRSRRDALLQSYRLAGSTYPGQLLDTSPAR